MGVSQKGTQPQPRGISFQDGCCHGAGIKTSPAPKIEGWKAGRRCQSSSGITHAFG